MARNAAVSFGNFEQEKNWPSGLIFFSDPGFKRWGGGEKQHNCQNCSFIFTIICFWPYERQPRGSCNAAYFQIKCVNYKETAWLEAKPTAQVGFMQVLKHIGIFWPLIFERAHSVTSSDYWQRTCIYRFLQRAWTCRVVNVKCRVTRGGYGKDAGYFCKNHSFTMVLVTS